MDYLENLKKLTYKSRQIILNLLENRGYDISNMINFSFNEIEIMFDNDNCDFELTHNTNNNKLKVVYLFDKKKIPMTNLMKKQFFEKLNIILDTYDEAIFILPQEDKDNNLQEICNDYYDRFNKFSQVFFISKLIFDITTHIHVPKHEIMDKPSIDNMKLQYNITNLSQLPIISRNDAVAKFIGVRKHDVVKISRVSETSGITPVYRYCL